MGIREIGLIPVWLFEDKDALRDVFAEHTMTENVEELTKRVQLLVSMCLQISLRRNIASGIDKAFNMTLEGRESERQVMRRVTGMSPGHVNRMLRSVGVFSNSEPDQRSDTSQLLAYLEDGKSRALMHVRLETPILLSLAAGEDLSGFIASPPRLAATLASRILSCRVARSEGETELLASERTKREYPVVEAGEEPGSLGDSAVCAKAKMACYGLYVWQAAGLMFREGWSSGRIDEALRHGGRRARSNVYFRNLVPDLKDQGAVSAPDLPEQLADVFRRCVFEVADHVGRALCGLPPYTRPLRDRT
jgi:hypothetical protein